MSQLGARAVLLDVDNTIASYTSHEPIEGAVQWAQNMVEAGFRVMIVFEQFQEAGRAPLPEGLGSTASASR